MAAMIERLRPVALVVAGVALLGIGLRPTRVVTLSLTEAVLATPGVDPGGNAVRRLADSLGATVYPGVDELRRARPSLRRLHVVGHGLTADEWRDLDSMPLVLHPTPLPAGIQSISWPAVVPLGDPLIVDAKIGGGRRDPVVLRDPAGVAVDSAAPAGDGAFRVAAVPRAAGRHRYTIQGETLSVHVVAPPRWRVLVLEATPSFETSALRDWLARNGGTAGVRTAISRDRVRTEFVNLERTALSPVTSRLLEQFDAVVIDGRTLAALPGSERAALRTAVTGGLGVLVVPDTSLFAPMGGDLAAVDREFFFGFTPVRIPDLDVRLVRPPTSWYGAEPTTAVTAAPYQLAARFGVAATIVDGSGATLAQVAPRGEGRVGVSLVTGAAGWRRAGADAAFAGYWSRLLASVATGSRAAPQWTIESPGPWFVDQPVTIAVTASRRIPVAILTGGGRGPGATHDSVFLAPDPLEPARQRGIYWPREPGWHIVDGGPGFYAERPGVWVARQATLRRAATERHAVAAGREGGLTPAPGGERREVRRPIPALWFFTAFVLAAAVLWSARRPVRLGRPGTPARRTSETSGA